MLDLRASERHRLLIDGQFRSVDEVGRQVVAARGAGTSVLVRDVATVRDGEGFRASAATSDGRGETLNAMAQMVAGSTASVLISRPVAVAQHRTCIWPMFSMSTTLAASTVASSLRATNDKLR